MTTYFYTNSRGERLGPISDQQLRDLAALGAIGPNTPMETEGGYKGVAGQIPGLNFPLPTIYDAQTLGQPHPQEERAKSESTRSILLWPLDFPFQDIRVHIIHRWACMIGYALFWIVAVFFLFIGTFGTFAMVGQLARHSGTWGTIGFLLVPLLWIGIAFLILLTRLYFELCIVILDWIVVTSKAARIYIEEKEKQEK